MPLDPSQHTPMMRQYLEIKAGYPDMVLFFRLGDFYEMFFDDAKQVSKELNLTLTGRGKDANRIPMCGVPHHAAEGYISKLIAKGYKVAICEQIEDPPEGKGLTKRDVVKVITPSTHIGDTAMATHDNLYLVAICHAPHNGFGFSFVDCSTGEFKCCVVDSIEAVGTLCERIAPKEYLIEDGIHLECDGATTSFQALSTERAITEFNRFFKIHHLTSFGLDTVSDGIPAAWAIIDYLSSTQKHALAQLTRCLPYCIDDAMVLDSQTLRNLEIFKPLYGQEATGSLFWVLNKTKTSMGARTLKSWLLHPLTSTSLLNQRYDAIESLLQDILSREEIRQQLHQIQDIERLLTRIVSGVNNPRDLEALKESLLSCLDLATILTHFDDPILANYAVLFKAFQSPDHPIQCIIKQITDAIIDPAPAGIAAGHMIKPGYNSELDSLMHSFKEIKEWIGSLEQKEQEQTGIKSLRVGFNKVFGYYFQVSKGQTDHVPDHYIRKQTLTQAERYITPELKEKETILLHGEEKQIQLEQQIYATVVAAISEHTKAIQDCAGYLAELDCLQSMATVAQQHQYCRPILTDKPHELLLNRSRHPVLEKQSPHHVISNTVSMTESDQILLITGPNMAGKSTVMKQVALATIMAQAGCFVAADSARIGIVDRCFTRIGAADNLAHGQSTFMVEMTETATILHNATPKSLIILDEIGRGTSTYDGMSIAGAVVDYIHSVIKARTLFATHYHELTSLSTTCSRVKNMSMAINEHEGKLVFTYTLIDGPADKSYGIHVAEMAGLPQPVIDHAHHLLSAYETMAHDDRQLVLF